MTQNLSGKTAVITGASGGIGHAIAMRLAKENMNIVLFGGNNLAKLNAAREQVSAITGCLMIPGNLTDTTSHAQMLEQVINTFGTLDVLINCAGMALNAPFDQTSEEQFDTIMDINVRVPYFLTQQAIPYLKQSDSATIINIASVVAHSGYPCQSAYAASKHALLGFTKSLGAEYYQDNIRVHAIAPGAVYTDMVKIARPDLKPDGMTMPEDIAEIIAFLLLNRNNAVIDEILVHRANKQPFLV